jgi:hypothetical protein
MVRVDPDVAQLVRHDRLELGVVQLAQEPLLERHLEGGPARVGRVDGNDERIMRHDDDRHVLRQLEARLHGVDDGSHPRDVGFGPGRAGVNGNG